MAEGDAGSRERMAREVALRDDVARGTKRRQTRVSMMGMVFMSAEFK